MRMGDVHVAYNSLNSLGLIIVLEILMVFFKINNSSVLYLILLILDSSERAGFEDVLRIMCQ